jgi:hypothetical protein
MPSDHVLFDEALAAFTAPEPDGGSDEANPHRGYLLLDFEIHRPLENLKFVLTPTVRVNLPGPYAAFIAEVHPRRRTSQDGAHSFATAVAALVSFSLARPVRSPRNDWLFARAPLNDDKLRALAVQGPILIAGPGAHTSQVSPDTLAAYARRVEEVVDIVARLSHEEKILFLRAFRLVQLAHNSVRDDFSLAYYLLVSAIEILATAAVTRDELHEVHSSYPQWRLLAKENRAFAEVLAAYDAEVHQKKYLARRFVTYILRYAPVDAWSEHDHPDAELDDYLEHVTGRPAGLRGRSYHEVYPEQLNETMIEQVLMISSSSMKDLERSRGSSCRITA